MSALAADEIGAEMREEENPMTNQTVGVVLVVVSWVVAYLVSRALRSHAPGRRALREAEVPVHLHGKQELTRRRRYSPLHY